MPRGRPPTVNGSVAVSGEHQPPSKLARFSSNITLALPTRSIPSGFVLTCGTGDVGQLGLGEDVMEKSRPAFVSNIHFVDIAAGGMHNLCLTADGKIYTFGCNDEGALGRVTDEEGSFIPQIIDLPAKCIKVSAGDSHSACLLEDGRVFAWGSFRDSHGNMGLTLDGNKHLPIEILKNTKSVDIASGGDHLVILTEKGHLYTIGCAEQGQLGRVSTRSASGESRRGKSPLLSPDVVLMKSKKVVADAIWATTYCTFFREKHSTKIYGFGLNNYNQLGLPNESVPIFVPKLTSFENVKTICGGQHHTLVLKNDQKVYCIGRKEYGRLGIGNVDKDVETLTLIKDLADKNIVEIGCGETTSFAVTDTGELYSWGMGSNQQLGTGEEDDEYSPVRIQSAQTKEKKILKVSSGGQHSIFIVEDKTAIATNGSVTTTAAAKTKAVAAAAPKISETTSDNAMDTTPPPTTSTPAQENQSEEVSSTTKINGDSRGANAEEKTINDDKQQQKKGRKRKL
uniref:Putative alpha-tubulin suppressor n=1 Tax=Corethrella appendiculata TaxID=1370023 RepID=U5EXC8_9DIPT